MNRPLESELDALIQASIKARGPVERDVLRHEFDRCSWIVVGLGLIGALVIFFL